MKRRNPRTARLVAAIAAGLAVAGLLSGQGEQLSRDLLTTSPLLKAEPRTLQVSSGAFGGVLHDNLLQHKVYVTDVWQGLFQEGNPEAATRGIVMEVGMHRAIQCLQAAQAGFEAHCVEPSPRSFQRVRNGVQRAPREVQDRVHLYNIAAGGTANGTVPFKSSGGTGDHVGNQDMWTMKDISAPANDEKSFEIIEVPTRRLDDIIRATGKNVYLLKIDTQGFEPTVFAGLHETLSQHQARYVLFEYWPRGMDLLAGRPKDTCVAADLLQDLVHKYGYQLYALGVEAHPKAPRGWQKLVPNRPLDNFRKHCQWYLELEQQVPSEEYKMGYWSDILAVAPGVSIPSPTTRVGQALATS